MEKIISAEEFEEVLFKTAIKGKMTADELLLQDESFFEELVKARKQFDVRKANICNDWDRRRICKLILEIFLRYHNFQNKCSVNDFQSIAFNIEHNVWYKLKGVNLKCDELEEEYRLLNEAVIRSKGKKPRAMFSAEIKVWALNLNYEIFKNEPPEEIYPKFMDKIFQILTKEGRNGRREEINQFISGTVSDSGDLNIDF